MYKIKNEEILYNELLVIDSDADKHTCDVIGIGNDGKLLFVKEYESHLSNSYYPEREFFQIDKEEYLKCLGIAAKNIRLQRSISKGTTDFEVCYKGRFFRVGSAIRYIVHHKECSIFTSDLSLAKELDFSRIDKFEYEKTISIKECDVVRITHLDAESEDVLIQQEFSTSVFLEWLDTLQ